MLRALPSVDRLATAVARAELEARRAQLLARDDCEPEVDLLAAARRRLAPSTRTVLNATGVVLHTNLGRAPLAARARLAVAAVAEGYSALELDLETGARATRGRRSASLLLALTGAQEAFVVNNGAAAVLLAAAALAGPGREVIVSRGELIEIGGGLRIADVVAQSGATLVEVGSTNRTRAVDYVRAISERTGAILRVHQSNFRMTGFVQRPSLAELVATGVPVIDDIGSGALSGGPAPESGEPAACDSVAAGAALVCFSADKLLGGPQAGLIAGRREAVQACRGHALARALRIDKLCLAALEATLELHLEAALDQIPVLEMLRLDPADLRRRTVRLAELSGGELISMGAPVGGGSLPGDELEGPAVQLPASDGGAQQLAARLRAGDPPLIARIHGGRVVLSARTLTEAEVELAGACAALAVGP
jgi:L-seryl-tRNA(Ser) seleniumtransferase